MSDPRLVIVGSGLATRLAPYTNHIPKFLINIGKHTGLHEILNFWGSHGFYKTTIIVNSRYKRMTEEYLKLYFPWPSIEVRVCDEALGTAHAISSSLGRDYDGENLLFSWCDIYPKGFVNIGEKPDSEQCYKLNLAERLEYLNKPGIFCDKNKVHRYELTADKKLLRHKVEEAAGDVCGIYYVPSFKQFSYSDGQDFIECIRQFGEPEKITCEIVDFGDLPKLQKVISTNRDGAREFNSIRLNLSTVEKTPITNHGIELIKKEIAWYQEAKKYDVACIPRSYKSISAGAPMLILQKIDGRTVFEELQSGISVERKKQIISKILSAMVELHSAAPQVEVDSAQAFADIDNEAGGKLKKRFEEIKDIMAQFPEVKYVNGVKVGSIDQTIHSLQKFVIEHYKSRPKIKYSLIHGDCQFSNTMISNDDKIIYIDPRGYFGSSKIYGLADYDYGKILYACSGYDEFNSSPLQEIKFDSSMSGNLILEPFKSVEFLANASWPKFDPIHYAWMVINWNGLAQYSKNDPTKMFLAMARSLYLAKIYFGSKIGK